MTQLFLDLGNIGLVFQRAGGGSIAQRVRAHVVACDAHLIHVSHHDIGVHAARREGAGQRIGAGRKDTPKNLAICFLAFATGGQILGRQAQCIRVGRDEAQLAQPLPCTRKSGTPPALLAEILYEQFCQLFAAQRAVQQHRLDRLVALAFEGVGRRRLQQRAPARRSVPASCLGWFTPSAALRRARGCA
jgi:hypothetical protein